ncbi:hypothetical protein BDN71DRAFT_1436063 [Pleurotus eryngii]|uniref:Uncharacterized protein n=1 Tax=Pleurotus eryngii TaxID=5323 RepID=A0A9P5ZIU8_PLEER|nr:hypothetical protein BDN71DRAFT_1436063 [Pleurotus eryngii]
MDWSIISTQHVTKFLPTEFVQEMKQKTDAWKSEDAASAKVPQLDTPLLNLSVKCGKTKIATPCKQVNHSQDRLTKTLLQMVWSLYHINALLDTAALCPLLLMQASVQAKVQAHTACTVCIDREIVLEVQGLAIPYHLKSHFIGQ